MTSVRNNAVIFMMGWFIFGFLNCIVFGESASTKTITDKGQNLEVDDNMPVSDYNYSDEESPEQMKAPHKIISTVKPYFDEENKTMHSQKDSKVSLDCPAKNYNESQHQILWFKDGKLITNGKNILSNTDVYQLDMDLSLTIDKVDEKTMGDYYCTVMPQNVSRHIHLNIGAVREEQNKAGNRQPMVVASASSFIGILFVREIIAFWNVYQKF